MKREVRIHNAEMDESDASVVFLFSSLISVDHSFEFLPCIQINKSVV